MSGTGLALLAGWPQLSPGLSWFDPSVWGALATLTVMEIVLGIDNVIFLSLFVASVPASQRERVRRFGLGMALALRIAMLFGITWLIQLKQPVTRLAGQELSWRDLVLIAGGAFLIYKATHEMHTSVEGRQGEGNASRPAHSFFLVLLQIVVIDLVFSIDSIITAVGMAEHVEVMIAAVVLAMAVMYFSSLTVAGFIEAHPTTKVLALAFLMLVGVALIADGLHFHIPRGYIYCSMAFAAAVELLNIRGRRRRVATRAPDPMAVEQRTRSTPSAGGSTVPRETAPEAGKGPSRKRHKRSARRRGRG